ncbi:hypothetical protein K0018_08705 [Staphylococcus massiliensis]|uniref:hypothetical protein n=1 Tax=Staphylococcus massiliensis TaxID=555791 RepID=UPI001EE109DB|nr:hypothetical protein [Staphylococcus massiliensis]MCG3413140.1 hypothetical protein [Staphylococcus massiliensis]
MSACFGPFLCGDFVVIIDIGRTDGIGKVSRFLEAVGLSRKLERDKRRALVYQESKNVIDGGPWFIKKVGT